MLPLLLIALTLSVDAIVAHDISPLGFSPAVEIFSLPYTPSQRRFSLEVEEENRLGDIIFRVVPSPDSGVSCFSRLDIAPNCSGAAYFTVSNASAGDITLFRLLDFEFAQTLDIDVRAWLAPPAPDSSLTNAALVAPMAHALVNVKVININDHEPVFDSPKDPLTGELYAHVSENAPPGTLVAKLHASDADQGETGELRYLIVGVAPGTPTGFAEAFGVDPVEGAVRVVNSTLLDRESFREVDLLVAAVDNPNHPNRQYAAISRLTIALTDQNDNAPKFNATSFTVDSVCECARTGALVAQLIAQDSDESSQNQVTYRLVDANVTFASYVPPALLQTDPRTLFAINPSTGRVNVIAASLAALIGSYSLLIEAADQGGLSSRTVLFFNISSDNKFAPEFTVPPNGWTDGASIAENLPSDTRVFQVTAIDRDTFGTNNQVEFFFYNNLTDTLVSQSASGFRIHRTTGVIYSARSFDAEADPPVIELAVVARDRGTPPLQTNGTLFVRILDQDEFPPRWPVSQADGCNTQFSFWIPERSPIGGRVGRVYSLDSDRFNKSYFRLEARNDAKYFAINPTTGVITIANPDPANSGTTTPGQEVAATFLDFEDKEHRDFVLFVTVSPLGGDVGMAPTTLPTSSGQGGTPTGCLRGNAARVHVHLTNMEDDRPSFSRGNKPYYYCVSGDAVRNTLVSYLPPITASDPDGSKLTFRMSSNEWRSSAGFVSVSCALRMQQPPLAQTEQIPTAQLVVNSAIGNYSRSYFRVPMDVRDESGQSASSVAYVWVTPPECDTNPATSTDLTVASSANSDEVILPKPPPDKSTYYATLTVAQKYDVFLSKLSEWVDCVSERLLAGDRWLAGAPICVASVAAHPNDPSSLTEVRIAAASKSDMLLMPAVLLVQALQQHINSTGGGLCGVIGATCGGCTATVEPLISGAIVAGPADGFDPLALLIALACILLFLILLLLILLAICCRPRRKPPILVPAPPPPPVVPVFAVKPARLYETQEAYMSVDHDQIKEREFEEQEVVLNENEEGEQEEVFEIPLPREYETQTVLMEMPTWAAREYGHDNPTLILDHGAGEQQQITLTHQHGARHLSGSVYSEPYFKSTHAEQRAFSMLHIDTRPQPTAHPPAVARVSSSQMHHPQPRRHVPASTVEMSPAISISQQQHSSRQVVHTMPPPPMTPPTNSSVTGRSSRAGAGTPNLPGGISHISRRLDESPHSRQMMMMNVPRGSPRPTVGGLLRPAISADSITLLSHQQQARRAALQQQQHEQQPEIRIGGGAVNIGGMGGGGGAGGRTDESEPSEAEDALRRHHLEDDDMRGGGNGRLRRTRSLPKYLQPPAELQSVMAELHDYIKSPEQKARRRRISQKYRAKLLASGGGAALGTQTGQTSSSSDSLGQDSQTPSQQQSSNGRNSVPINTTISGNNRGRDFMML